MGTKSFSGKGTRKTIQYAVANGFTVKRNGKHAKLTKDDQVVTVSTSSSCPYGMANAMKDIDKALNIIKGRNMFDIVDEIKAEYNNERSN